MLICLSRAFLLTCPPNATWSIDETIPTLTRDAKTTVYKRAEEIVKQAFARQPSYDDLVPALLKLGVDKLAKHRLGFFPRVDLRQSATFLLEAR